MTAEATWRGGLRFEAQELGWIGLGVGVSAFTLSMIFALAIIVVVVARRLRASDLELRRLAAIVDASGDAMINKTADGVILSWNRAAERMYGYSADEVVGGPVAILAPADHPDEIPMMLDRVRHGEIQRVRRHLGVGRQTQSAGQILEAALVMSARGPGRRHDLSRRRFFGGGCGSGRPDDRRRDGDRAWCVGLGRVGVGVWVVELGDPGSAVDEGEYGRGDGGAQARRCCVLIR